MADVVSPATMDRHVQVRFVTRQPQYAVPDVPYSIPVNVGYKELSEVINSVLKESAGINFCRKIGFDFIIAGEFLRLSLLEHLQGKGTSTENVIDVEYIEEYPPPNARNALQHDDWVSSVHACENWFLSGCYDNSVHIYTTEGKFVKRFVPHLGPVKSVRWLDAGGATDEAVTFVTASHDQTAMQWRWERTRNDVACVATFRGHERSVDCTAVDTSGRWLATGSHDKTLKLWSLADGDAAADTELVESGRKRFRSSGPGPGVANRAPTTTLSGHNEAVTAVQWTSPDEVCTASSDHTIRIWDLELGGMKSQLVGTNNFMDVAYSELNHLLVSASGDRHVRLWDHRSKDASVVKGVFTSHNNWVSCVCWSRTNEHHFLSGSYDNVLKQWDLRSPQVPYFNLSGHRDKVLCCNWNHPRFILSGGADNLLQFYDSLVF